MQCPLGMSWGYTKPPEFFEVVHSGQWHHGRNSRGNACCNAQNLATHRHDCLRFGVVRNGHLRSSHMRNAAAACSDVCVRCLSCQPWDLRLYKPHKETNYAVYLKYKQSVAMGSPSVRSFQFSRQRDFACCRQRFPDIWRRPISVHGIWVVYSLSFGGQETANWSPVTAFHSIELCGKNPQQELEIEADSKLCYTTGHDISKKKTWNWNLIYCRKKTRGRWFSTCVVKLFFVWFVSQQSFLYDLPGDAEWDTDGYKTCKGSQLWCRIVKCRAKSHWCWWLEGLWI